MAIEQTAHVSSRRSDSVLTLNNSFSDETVWSHVDHRRRPSLQRIPKPAMYRMLDAWRIAKSNSLRLVCGRPSPTQPSTSRSIRSSRLSRRLDPGHRLIIM